MPVKFNEKKKNIIFPNFLQSFNFKDKTSESTIFGLAESNMPFTIEFKIEPKLYIRSKRVWGPGEIIVKVFVVMFLQFCSFIRVQLLTSQVTFSLNSIY